MRRIVLLGLLALALPTATLANTINRADFSVLGTSRSSPPLQPFHAPWTLTLNGLTNGHSDTIRLDIMSLTGCGTPNTECRFTGDVTASGPGISGTFSDTLSGSIHRGANTVPPHDRVSAVRITSLVATFAENNLILPGSHLTLSNIVICTDTHGSTGPCLNGHGHIPGQILSGHATLDATEIPEPGTLGLLGTGLIGLAGMARRRLALWT